MTDTVEPLTVTRHERTATTKRWYHGLRYLFAMPTQSFRFGRWLRRYDLSSEIEGPRFHRWLPNGESDALVLKTDDPAADLRVWFERQGRMDGAFFQFAHKEQSFDPAVITRQGVLEAGPPSVDRAKPAICRHFKTGHFGESDRGQVSSISRFTPTANPCGPSFSSSVVRISAHAHDAAGDRAAP